MGKAENYVFREVWDYLTLLKSHHPMYFFRVNNTPIYDPKNKTFRAMPKGTPKGVPDIILCWYGRFIGIELKLPEIKDAHGQKIQSKTYLSNYQKVFRAKISDAYGLYITARCSKDVEKVLKPELGLTREGAYHV